MRERKVLHFLGRTYVKRPRPDIVCGDVTYHHDSLTPLTRPLVYTTVTLRPSEAQAWRGLGRWLTGEKDEPPTPKGLPDLTGVGRVRGGGST